MATAPQLDDRSIVLAAQDGNDEALAALLRTLADRLLPLASALCGGTGEADALLGDTLSRVYERIGDLREPDAITSWSRRVMVRKFIDQKRWFRRRPKVSIDTVQIATPLGTSAEQMDLRNAVGRLGRRDRALMVLHYWQRVPISECARVLGIPEGTAKSRLNAALRRLRRELEDSHGN
ncbi:MAG: sigma-70 family RNA polymerase sigma factor [Chloroflexota bacterium]